MAQTEKVTPSEIAPLTSIKERHSTRLKYKDLQKRIGGNVLVRAEQRSIELERNDTCCTLIISLQYHVPFGEIVCITGSVRELGDWTPSDSLPLRWSEGDLWRLSVDVKRHELSRLEYKFLVRIPGDPPIFNWEHGSNHNILALPCRKIEIRDRWGFPGYNHNIT